MMQLLRQSVRSLAMQPGFSIVVLLILALCIGGNASIFSAARAVLFRELPYKDVDRLVVLSMYHHQTATETDLSWPEAMAWDKGSKVLEHMSPFLCWQDRLIVQEDGVERITINYVPSKYLALMGVRPQLGRLFTPEEDVNPGSAPRIILSHDLWDRLYSRDPQILGRKIVLNTKPYTVVGVMPQGFYDVTQGRWPIDAWIPVVQAGDPFPPAVNVYEARDARLWLGLARLKPGATVGDAQREAEVIAAQLEREFPDSNKDYGAVIIPIRRFMFEDLEERMRVLLVGAGLVLLIGCANIANLLLVRLAERRKELSLRLALGATRGKLIQHVLVESLILAVAGGALGLLLAVWGTRLLAGMVDLPPVTRVELDGGVLAVSVIATLLTGILFGLPPAISVARMDSTGTLQQIRASGSRTHTSQSRSGLLVFQVATVVVLLIMAGLLLRSFWSLQSAGVDFDTKRLMTLRIAFETEGFEEQPRRAAAVTELLRRLEEVPGVEAAATWGPGIPGMGSQFTELLREGSAENDSPTRADMHTISPGALRVLGVPLLKGREFTMDDDLDAPRVAVISQSLADVLWPGQDALGKRFFRPGREPGVLSMVVGVIPDIRFQGRFFEGTHHMIFPARQLTTFDTNLLVRTGVESGTLLERLKKVVRQVNSQIPVYDFRSLEDRMQEQEGGHRLNAAVVSIYAVLALLLALLGLYGMLAYSVVQRTQEIGVRIALGADRPGILGMIMKRGLLLVGSGVVLGMAGALALTRFLASLLFGVEAVDPVTFVAVAVLFTGVAVIAAYLPARQAMKVEPTIALRYE